LVVALMAQEVGSSLETFTAGFADARLDESSWASRVARHLGVKNHVVRLDSSALEDLPALAWQLDEPVGDRAALPTYHLSRLARQHVKVALTGEGSDELFGGYPRYRLEHWAQRFHRLPMASRPAFWRALLPFLPPRIRTRLAKLILSSPNPGLRRAEWVSSFSASARESLLRVPGILQVPQPASGHLEAQLRLDQETWLVDNVLMKVDKMTMAASLEARVPFLDNELIDWAWALPDADKLRGGVGKHVVKQAALGLLPREVVYRPKQAFHTPTAVWFREPRGQAILSDVLLSRQARERDYFNPQEVERLIRAHQAGENHDQALWNLLILELWLNAYIDASPLALALPGAPIPKKQIEPTYCNNDAK
jgi:asparagine synthase (glutamine-hydrolysing)